MKEDEDDKLKRVIVRGVVSIVRSVMHDDDKDNLDLDYWDEKLERVIIGWVVSIIRSVIHDEKDVIKDDLLWIIGIESESEIFCSQDSDFGIEELWRWVSFLEKDADFV